MSPEQQQLEATIAGLEAQRSLLGDAVVDAALAPLRRRLASFEAASPVESTQTLKQVSILFLDVVGSTRLSQRLDPEDISDVMDNALAGFAAIVAQHGGKVLKYAGDSVMAVFGADRALEDDPERAVRAGLALLEEGRRQGELVKQRLNDAEFNVRVGVHCGDVLLGGGVDAESSIRGQAVNVAARMEQSAPVGALRISHDTYTQVRGLFDVEVQAPLAVKGVDQPIQSYLVLQAKPRLFHMSTRGIEGVATRMVGRDTEMQALQECFKSLFSGRRLTVATVVADAGIGKSRLLDEFDAWTLAWHEPFQIFRGRATPQTQRQPFGLLRDIIAGHFRIADDDTVADAKAKLQQGIVPLFVEDEGIDRAEGHAHLLGHLIGIEYRDSRHIKGILQDPRQIRSRAVHTAAQLFRRMSAREGRPVVLQLEDLHWADDETLDFLIYVAQMNADVPMLMLAFTRPTLFERRTDWDCIEGNRRRVDLVPLDKDFCRQLADELLRKLPDIPAALRDLLTGGSEGNPFYMEELVRMLIDQGAIQTAAERWTVDAARLSSSHVPVTLTGVLQARLDGLPGEEKLTLQEASVIGPVFWDQALFALDARTGETLPALVRRELTLPRGDASAGGLREYAFKHQILQQVTYNTVLKRSKRHLHGKLARWLADQTGLRANDFLGLIAEHYEQAGDMARAAEFHARAAERAKLQFAHAATLDHVRRGLAMLDQQTETQETRMLRWRLLDVRERTLDIQAHRVPQRADIDAMVELADALADDARRAHAAWRRGYIAMMTADWDACQDAGRQAVALAGLAGAHETRLLSMRMIATALARKGDLEAAQEMGQASLDEARSLGLPNVEPFCLNTLAVVANLKGDMLVQLQLCRETLAVISANGDRRGEAIELGNVGAGLLALGQLEQGQRDLLEALRLIRANGDQGPECFMLHSLSWAALCQLDFARALALAKSAVASAVAVRARGLEIVARIAMGDAELALGHFEAANAAFDDARLQALAIDNPVWQDARAGLARVALAKGDVAAARQCIGGMLDHVVPGRAPDGNDFSARLYFTFHQVLAASGDTRANEWLERAHRSVLDTAVTISDASLRQSFLTNLPDNRAIEAAWTAMVGPP